MRKVIYLLMGLFIFNLNSVNAVTNSYNLGYVHLGCVSQSLNTDFSFIHNYMLYNNINMLTDSVAPTIEGVHKIYANLGDGIIYKKGITVKDDFDKNPILKVDTSKVDYKKPGIYPIVYKAIDHRGNNSEVTTEVIIKEKITSTQDMEKIAKGILAKIIKPEMTTEQKITAIYNWVKFNIRYDNNYKQTEMSKCASDGLINRKGDCYVYAAVSKVLLEMEDIETMDIKRIPTTYNHLWNLVCVDGKWYHFDATPRKGLKTPILFMKDAELKKLSPKFKGAFDYDNTLYPEIQ